jgi:hypothetical protein
LAAALAGLVAHHSEASSVAGVRGRADELDRFPREDSLVADALSYADQTVGPDGRSMTFEQRQADMLSGRGPKFVGGQSVCQAVGSLR